MTIPAESKKFSRTYEVRGEMTLFRFNTFILTDLGFAPDQMVIFEGYDEKGNVSSEYGLFDMGDGSMDTVSFEDIVSRGEMMLHYVFDLHSERFLVISIEGEVPQVAVRSYPAVVAEAGPMPTQFEKMVEIEEEPIHARKRSRKDDGKLEDDEDYDDDDDLDDDDLDDEDDEDEDSIYDGEEGKEIYGEE